MSHIEITPDLLEIIKLRAVAYEESKASPRRMLDYNRKNYLKAANPAVMLAMIERIRQLEAAQCWVIVNKETKATFLGPFFTEAHANDKLGSMPFEYAKNYKVQPWKGGAE